MTTRSLSIAAGIVLLTSGAACSGFGRQEPEPWDADEDLHRALSEAARRDVGSPSLTVRLAFGDEADLDLYVTDPLAETVYFANPETRSGGRLRSDRRCDAPAPRIEQIRFEHPLPGRYRVGVDYSHPCRGGGDPVAFVVQVQEDRSLREIRGVATPRTFQPIVVEFEIESVRPSGLSPRRPAAGGACAAPRHRSP